MEEELQKLIEDFNKKFEEAKDARSEVMAYLEEQYDIDTRKEYETMEDACDWCYGIDTSGVEMLIEKAKSDDM